MFRTEGRAAHRSGEGDPNALPGTIQHTAANVPASGISPQQKQLPHLVAVDSVGRTVARPSGLPTYRAAGAGSTNAEENEVAV